jgi:hypothetical protein
MVVEHNFRGSQEMTRVRLYLDREGFEYEIDKNEEIINKNTIKIDGVITIFGMNYQELEDFRKFLRK